MLPIEIVNKWITHVQAPFGIIQIQKGLSVNLGQKVTVWACVGLSPLLFTPVVELR